MGGSQQSTFEVNPSIFYARCCRRNEVELPPTLPNIERVSSIKALGVTINSQLSMNGHVTTLSVLNN